ncbi:MAG: tetratricopeptide repeat protein [Candidatus Sumerlaeia bacterium]
MIDGHAFARLIDYFPDKIQVSGSSLKCFCPVHHELAFRSLIINLRNNTYKCMMKHCPCFEGGTLVQFWSIYKQMEPVEAALELSEKLNLSVDVEMLKRLGTEYADKAKAALKAGDVAQARAMIDSALSLDTKNQKLRLFSAQVREAEGRADQALEERLAVLDGMLAAERLEDARKLLKTLNKAAQPNQAGLIEREIAIARLGEDGETLADALARLAGCRRQEGALDAAIAAMEEVIRLKPQDRAALAALADDYAAAGNQEPHFRALEALADLHRAAGDIDALLDVLGRLTQMRPEDYAAREKLIEALDQAGRAEEVRARRLHLVEEYGRLGQHRHAERLLGQLIEAEPENIELKRLQADLVRQSGDTDRAVKLYRALAASAAEAGQAEMAQEFYGHARTLDPANPELRLELADWKLASGDTDGGIFELFSLADFYFEAGRNDEARGLLDRIAGLVGTDLDKRLRIGRCLENNGLEAEACEGYHALTRALIEEKRLEAAQVVCKEARRLQPRRLETLDLRVEIELAQGRKLEAIEACRQTARACLAGKEDEAAEQILKRGIKIDRCETSIKTDLAKLYEKQGRRPLASEQWIEIALVRRAQGDQKGSNEAVREALRLTPDNREARVMLAEGLAGAGQTREALELWKELAREVSGGDAEIAGTMRLIQNGLELAPNDRELLGIAGRMLLATQGPAAARIYVEHWLDTFETQPDPVGAMAAWRLAVEHYPDDVAWRRRLASMLLADGNRDEAAEQFEKLREVMAGAGAEAEAVHEVLEQLVQLRPGRADLRRDQAESLIGLGRAREAVAIHEELGEQAIRNGDLEDGLAALERALEFVPDDAALIEKTARLCERTGHNDRAMEHYERLAEIGRRHSDRSRTMRVLEKLLAFNPDRRDLRGELAEIYLAEGDLDRAIEQHYRLAQTCPEGPAGAVAICRRLRQLAPEFVPGRELLVDGLIAAGQADEARQELDALGDLALGAGQLDRAENYFRRVREVAPDDIGGQERLAKLLEARGKLEEAADAFAEVLEIYEAHGEVARSLEVMQKLRQLKPDDVKLRTRLARKLTEAGERREAADEWLALVELTAPFKSRKHLAAILDEARPIFAEDWPWRLACNRKLDETGCKEALEEWAALQADALAASEWPVSIEAADAGLALDGARVDLLEGRVMAQRRLANYGAAVGDLSRLAGLATADGRHADAESYLAQAIQLQSDNLELLEALADAQQRAGRTEPAVATRRRLVAMYRQQGRAEQAIGHLRRLIDLQPEDGDLKDQLAGLLMGQGNRDEAREIWRAMAEACFEAGDLAVAQARYARLLELYPGNIDMLRRLADLAYEEGGMLNAMGHYDRLLETLHAAGDEPATLAEYNRILELEPGHLHLKERLADYLNELGRADEARRMLIEVVAVWRDERGQFDDALRVLERLKALYPDDLDLLRQQAFMHEKLGRADLAAGVWRELAATHRRAGANDAAIECLEHAAALAVDSADVQVEAADMLRRDGRIDDAVEYLLRAIEIHDRNDRPEPMAPILRQAIELAPGRLDLPAALAQLFERLERVAEAADQWMALAHRHESKGDPAASRDICLHLKQLMPEHLDCRRRLAKLLEAAGDRVGAIRELRDLARLAVEQRAPRDAADTLERLLRIDPHDEAAMVSLCDLWEKLDQQEEHYQALARLEAHYCAAGKYDHALSALERLRKLRPDDPELAARGIDLLVQTGNGEEAAAQGMVLVETWLERDDEPKALETLRRVAEIRPEDSDLRIELALILKRHGHADAASQEFHLSALKMFEAGRLDGALAVCSAGIEAFENDATLRDLSARILARLGRSAEAIEAWLQLAAVYDEQGETDRAQRVYESVLAEAPDDQSALEAMVEWALRRSRTALAIEHLVRLAEAHYLAGRLPESIGTLERIGGLDPGRLDLRARLGELYWEAGEIGAAQRTWLETARAMDARGEADAALKLLERASAAAPDDIETLAELVRAADKAGRAELHQREGMRLAGGYELAGRLDDALAIYETLSSRNPAEPAFLKPICELYSRRGMKPEAVGAWTRLFEVHRDGHRFEPARLALESALTFDPENPRLLESMGDLCLTLGRRPEGVGFLMKSAAARRDIGEWGLARDLAERALKLDPLDIDLRRLLAEVLEEMGRQAEAAAEYVQVGRALAEAHRAEEARAVLSHLLVLDPARHDERELLARLLAREGRIEEAVEQYRRLLEFVAGDEDARPAIKYCRQILALDNDNAMAHERLCDIYEKAQKLRQAFSECEWLAEFHAGCGELEAALKAAGRGLAWFPEELAMRRRVVELLVGLDRGAEAAAQLVQVASLAEARADAPSTAWALDLACKLEPDDLEHRRRLADFQERTGAAADARQTRLELIDRLLAAGEMEPARQLAERVVDSAGADEAAVRGQVAAIFDAAGLPEVAAYHYHQLARAAMAAGDPERARELANRTLGLKARHVGARQTLIEALVALHEANQAVEEYDRLFEIYNEMEEWEPALATLQSMIELAPSRPGPRRKLVDLLRRMNRGEAVIDHLRRLVELHVSAGRHQEAIECLRELMVERPEDTRARIRYIDLYTQLGDEAELAGDYLELARIFARKGALIEATQIYEKLIAIHPTLLVAREELIQFLFAQGQVHRAIDETRQLAEMLEQSGQAAELGKALERALNYAPDDLDLRRRLAGVYLATNRRGQALETFRSLARAYEQSREERPLLSVYEKIIEIDPLNIDYRQRLADLARRVGDTALARTHLSMLASQYNERGLHDLAEQACRRIMEMEPNSIKAVEDVVRTHLLIGSETDITTDLTTLANLYAAAGRLNEAVNTLRRVLDHDPDNIELLRRYIDYYIQIGLEQDLVDEYLKLAELASRANNVQEAARIYQHLLEIVPGNPEIQGLLSSLSARARSQTPRPDESTRGRLGREIDQLERLLGMNADNLNARVRLVEIYEQMGIFAKADPHLAIVAETMLARGDMERGAAAAHRYLQRHPDDSTMARRLTGAEGRPRTATPVDELLAKQIKML